MCVKSQYFNCRAILIKNGIERIPYKNRPKIIVYKKSKNILILSKELLFVIVEYLIKPH